MKIATKDLKATATDGKSSFVHFRGKKLIEPPPRVGPISPSGGLTCLLKLEHKANGWEKENPQESLVN